MTSFGTRLKEERKRLKMTQAEIAGIGGVQPNAQIIYEKDGSSPNAEYLMKLADAGIDITYLFYGTRSDLAASQHVQELLGVLLDLPPAQQAMSFAMLTMMRRGAVSSKATVQDADVIWRAARLFEQFMSMDKRGHAVVEKAIEGAMLICAVK